MAWAIEVTQEQLDEAILNDWTAIPHGLEWPADKQP
jgi:hypothetical protein